MYCTARARHSIDICVYEVLHREAGVTRSTTVGAHGRNKMLKIKWNNSLDPACRDAGSGFWFSYGYLSVLCRSNVQSAHDCTL